MSVLSIEEVIHTVHLMIEEAQREANRAPTEAARQRLLAKRDALTEAKFRIRDGRVNSDWIRHY